MTGPSQVTYPFPDDVRDPNRQGPNPFADDPGDEDPGDADQRDREGHATGQDAAGAAGQPYAAAHTSAEYRPSSYAPTLVPRSRRVLGLGLGGTLLVGGGGTASFLLGAPWLVQAGAMIYTFLPITFLGFCLSLVAWWQGHRDQRAIAAGAMLDEGLGSLRWGTYAGMFGTLVGGAVVALTVAWLTIS